MLSNLINNLKKKIFQLSTPNFRLNRGQSFIELLVAIGIFAMISSTVVVMVLDSYLNDRQGKERSQATVLAQEGMEAARSIRDNFWIDLTNGTHGLDSSSGYWKFSSSPKNIGKFTQSITIEDVRRRALFMEAGSVSTDESWMQVNLQNNYINPVIVTFYYENNNTLPASTRIRNITSNSFEVRLQHPSEANLFSDTIYYLVVEEGKWRFKGRKIEAHKYETNKVSASPNIGGSWDSADSKTYSHTYSAAPIVLHQVMSYNDASWITSWVSKDGDRENPPTVSGFQIGLNGAEATTTHGIETIGWVAIEKEKTGLITTFDQTSMGWKRFETQVTGDTIRGYDNGCYTFSFYLNYADAPLIIASQQQMDGTDGSWLVGCSLSESEIGFHCEEDQEYDSERGHATEIGAFLVLEKDFSVQLEEFKEIVTSGGLVDPQTKKITSKVVWDFTPVRPSEVIFSSYLSNWATLDFQQTLRPDFDSGLKENLVSNNLNDGEIQLADDKDWSGTLVRGFYDIPADNVGSDIFVVGNFAYLIAEEIAPAEFYIFNVSDSSSPELLSSLDLGTEPNSIYVLGDYAYLATDDNSRELLIINIADPKNPGIVGYYDVDSSANANEVFVKEDYAYLVTQRNNTSGINPEFYIINISDPASPSTVSYLEINSDTNSIYVEGDYAYITTDLNSAEFVVVDISDKENPFIAASYNLSGSGDGMDVFVTNESAYVVTRNNSGSTPEFFILDVSTPSNPSLIGSLNIGSSANAVYVPNNSYAYIGNDLNNQEFMVIDISAPSNPSILDILDLEGDANSVFFTPTNVYIANDNGSRELQIVEPGSGGWDNPSVVDTYNTNGNGNAEDVFVVGSRAYLVTRSNTGAQSEFFIFDISDPENVSLLGSLDLGTRANAVYVSGNYAYIATNSNSQELMVVDITNPSSLSIDGSYDAPSGANGEGIFVVGNKAYLVTRDSGSEEFYILDVSTPTLPILDRSLEIGDDTWDVYVDGNYAYLVTSINTQELIVVDITAGTLSKDATLNLTGNADAFNVFVDGNKAYVVRDYNGLVNPEFQIVDISTPTSPTQQGGINLEDTAKGVYKLFGSDFAFIGSDLNNQEFIVADVSDPNSPSIYSSIDLNTDANAVFVSGDYAYLATDDNSKEFQVIKKADIANTYKTQGSIESFKFDTGSANTKYNTISWTSHILSGTTLKFQIRTADTKDNLESATWVGPDGTSSTYYTSSWQTITLDPAATGSRWIQYKAYLEGDGNLTPILEDVTINYKP